MLITFKDRTELVVYKRIKPWCILNKRRPLSHSYLSCDRVTLPNVYPRTKVKFFYAPLLSALSSLCTVPKILIRDNLWHTLKDLILLFREVIGKVGRKKSQIQFIFAGRVENMQKNSATEFDTNIWLGFSEVFLNSSWKDWCYCRKFNKTIFLVLCIEFTYLVCIFFCHPCSLTQLFKR